MKTNHKTDTIIAYICHVFMVDRDTFLSRSRRDQVSRARHAFCQIMFDNFGMHAIDVADILKRNRSTVEYGRRACADLMDTDKHFRLAYNQAVELIRNNPHLAASAP